VSVFLAVLGPLRATVYGREADLGGPRQRAVPARLAVAGGVVIVAGIVRVGRDRRRPRGEPVEVAEYGAVREEHPPRFVRHAAHRAGAHLRPT